MMIWGGGTDLTIADISIQDLKNATWKSGVSTSKFSWFEIIYLTFMFIPFHFYHNTILNFPPIG